MVPQPPPTAPGGMAGYPAFLARPPSLHGIMAATVAEQLPGKDTLQKFRIRKALRQIFFYTKKYEIKKFLLSYQ